MSADKSKHAPTAYPLNFVDAIGKALKVKPEANMPTANWGNRAKD